MALAPATVASRHIANEAHDKSVALMKFLSKLAIRLGAAEHIYVVGGAVRDFVLERPIKDVDVVIDSVALGGRKDSEWFGKQVVRAIPARVNMTINNYGVALLNISSSWILDGLDMKGEDIEIANARTESYAKGGYKPTSVTPSDIEDDVRRRELTYNCMVGDTLIPTEKGLLRIDQIASRESGDQQEIHLRVSGKQGPSTAVGWQYSGHTRTVKVTSEWGHQFSCTGHHPVLVLQDNEHVWVKADDLSPGDLLCVPSEGLTRTDPLPLDLSDPVKPVRGWLKEVRKPQQMTPDLAFLMGCVVSEGSNTHKRVSFSNSDPAFISRYEESFEKVFGFRPSRNQIASAGDVRVFNGTSYTVSRDGFDVYADSKVVVGWLDELGLYMGGRQNGKTASHFKVVPWSILQADRQSQAAFLAAYLEGDGYIDPESGRITYISKSPTLRRQIQALLCSHGVLSQVQRRFVFVNAVDSAKLWAKIEPFMISKRFDYENRTFKSRNRFGIPKDYLSGFLKGRRLRSASRAGVFYQTDDGGEVALRGVGETIRTLKRLLHDAHARGDFNAFLDRLALISPVEAHKLKHLFRCSYQYVPVASVEEDGEQDVYDISMHEGVEPAFVANGVVVHNTLLIRLLDLANGPDKKDIIDLTGCGLKDLEEGRMQCPAPPDKVFSDDASRMIRVIKFALRYGHKLTPDTKAAIIRNAPKLKNVPSSHLAQLLTQIVLKESTWKKALEMMADLGLLEPVREITLKDKSFRSTLENYIKSQKMDMLFGLLDVGVPLGAPMGFLPPAEQTRFREIALGMERDEAWEFLGMVKNPGNAYKDKQFALNLAAQYGISGKAVGKFMPIIMEAGRELLLKDPGFARNPAGLKRALSAAVEDEMRHARTATESIPGGVGQNKKPGGFDPEELAIGISVEKEHLVGGGHSKEKMHDIAQEIAMDHLTEIPDYYTRLKKMESQAVGKKADARGYELRFTMRPGLPVGSWKDLLPMFEAALINPNGIMFRQHLYYLTGKRSLPRLNDKDVFEVAEWVRERYHSGSQPLMHAGNKRQVRSASARVAARHLSAGNQWDPDEWFALRVFMVNGTGTLRSKNRAREQAKTKALRKGYLKERAPGVYGITARGVDRYQHLQELGEAAGELTPTGARGPQHWTPQEREEVNFVRKLLQDMRGASGPEMRLANQNDGKTTGNGKSVGLFIPIPEPLASMYPKLSNDKSPAHTTLLFVGEVPKDMEQDFLDVLTETLSKEPGPIQAWTNGVDSFVHPHADRTVFYTPIRFSRDMGEVRDRLWVALEEAGFEVKHSFPMAFFPHATLEYADGTHHEHGYEGEVPDGAWTFDSIQVWGLSKTYDISLGLFEKGYSELTNTTRRYDLNEE